MLKTCKSAPNLLAFSNNFSNNSLFIWKDQKYKLDLLLRLTNKSPEMKNRKKRIQLKLETVAQTLAKLHEKWHQMTGMR